ncbi:1,4-dihydroxy-2-naphthoate polyprenyltransferase [Clostridium sp. D2Q-11]|uniref:1,4-dihydroxy-2-naphthoate polyprenyltransferase n=1 Tax=Anaeromonas frigoriresistens TaxID=2683708 RepID=A0A942Z7F6_9FIRM|nr:1,4-dihydroxy-2-naphthoate polyprenyltransferase [Anaeromonas frigoriresistens]MBS4538642.1 1,4-dihydroxy-2-naphthoate polyprenyltransferase [Anaeromonas frigoriresistens]
MNIISFLKLVEIQTKVASQIPFLLGTTYALYRYNTFDYKNFILLFISLLSFDMATTAINNYIDYKKAIKKHGFGYETHNAIVNYRLKESTVQITIGVLITIAISFGIVLFLNTNLVILFLGVLSFLVGVLYSFGPIPISRMPLGEIFSGIFMGFIISFISIYIHIYDKGVATILLQGSSIHISFNMVDIVNIFLVSLPAVVGIANIMLANNICDIDDDIHNKRYTLPIYIGKEKALNLFKYLYYILYMDIIVLVLLRRLPLVSLLVLITFVPVKKNIDKFFQKQTKKDTFIIAVKNFVLVNIINIFCIIIGYILTVIFA